ncbi:nuclear condensing complex subunit [Auriculariales sp. MPI-PUGE-AT-0066]|nr:nuclear condensing complex subunit [Auriculariales sp. MPI-PUGE-AT-0066]
MHDERTGDETAGTTVFEEAFVDMVNRILPVKKGSTGGVIERLIKFVAGYILHVGAKANDDGEGGEEQKKQEKDNEDEDNYATRFVSTVMEHIVQGFTAKDKAVRFHCVQLIAESIRALGAIDMNLYKSIRSGFLERTFDKEVNIRVAAIQGLGHWTQQDDKDTRGELIIDMLKDVLVHDPSPEVRKMAMLMMPLSPRTLELALTRVQDQDPSVRRLVYEKIVPAVRARHIRPEHLTAVVMAGLRDREETVKTAARSMVAGWVKKEEEDFERADDPTVTLAVLFKIIALFEFDRDMEATELTLQSIFESRRDILDRLDFSEQYWQQMSPEKALLARVFVDFCTKNKDEARMERTLPVVTAMAFRVQDGANTLDELMAEGDGADEDVTDQIFILTQMMRMAAQLDYADEIGRRKMFALVRNMLGQESLAEQLVAPCLDVLRVLSSSERDLIRVVVEIVHEDEETKAAKKAAKERKKQEEMSPEEQEHRLNLELRCLTLVIGMLERVNGSFEENSTLEGVLQDLIIPSVRSKHADLRERGLIALGLCCLIAKRMALQSFKLFLDQIQRASEEFQVRVLQIVFDMMMVHEAEFLGPRSIVGEGKLIEFLLHTFEHTESPKVQSVLSLGFSKLMLAGMVSDDRVLRALVLAYLSPSTADIQALRQCLAYFFPIFCYGSPKNQRMMSAIILPMLTAMATVREELDDSEKMISQANILNLMLDWTNPENQFAIPSIPRDEMVHVDMAIELVQALYEQDMDTEDKKVLCQGLSKIFIPMEVDDLKIRTLVVLVSNVQRRRPIGDSTARTALERFSKSLRKRFAEQLEGVTDEDMRKMDALTKLFEFMDSMPEVEEQEQTQPSQSKKRGSSKKLSDQGATTKIPSKKKRRVAESEQDSDEDQTSRASGSRAASPTPAREKHSRKAAPKKSLAVDEVDEEDEEEEEDDEPPSKSKGKGRARSSLSSVASASAADDDDDEDTRSRATSVHAQQDDDDDDESGSTKSVTPVPVSKPAQKRKERVARTPSNRASKKARTRSPAHDAASPKLPNQRVRSDVAGDKQSPPRKKLKEVANSRGSKRATSSRARSVSASENESEVSD